MPNPMYRGRIHSQVPPILKAWSHGPRAGQEPVSCCMMAKLDRPSRIPSAAIEMASR
jgi:hypothetical protein